MMEVKKNYCTTCKYNFLTETLFHAHRVGAFPYTTAKGVYVPATRRCATEAEMHAKGWQCQELDVRDLGMAFTWFEPGQLERRERSVTKMRKRYGQ